MEYKLKSIYDKEALIAMTRVVRKTTRKKKSVRSHAFGWIIVVLGLLVSLPHGNEVYTVDFNKILVWLAVAAILLTFLFEDRLNAAISKKHLLPGAEKGTTVFGEENFRYEIEGGTTEWHYDKIALIATYKAHIVFVFGDHHALACQKDEIDGGSTEDFLRFLEQKTGKTVVKVK